MEKKYLTALSNFAYALEELVENMAKQSDEKAKASKSGGILGGAKALKGIDKTLEQIKEGIDSIKDSNDEILSNQKTLIKMGKDREKSKGVLGGLTDKKGKKGILEGVSTIILMSGAILAIGLAFKVVGGIDFTSVMALSIALPLIAIAFTEVATKIKDKKLGVKDMLFTSLALILIAGALTLSSWIMAGIQPLSIGQFLTGVGIALTLAIASIGVSYIVKSLKKVKYIDLLKLPITLVAISTAIMLSSLILGLTRVIEPSLLLNIVLQGIAMGIVAAAMSIPLLLFKLTGLKTKDVLMGALYLVLIAGAVMLSSLLLSMGDYSGGPSIGWAFDASISLLLFSLPVIALGILSMTGVGLAAVAIGAVMTLIVAGTIMVSSHILVAGDYQGFPSTDWALGVSLALITFGGGMTILGGIALTGIGALAILAGGAMMLVVAATIVEVAGVLSKGRYEGGPTLGWALGTALLFGTLAPIMVMMGGLGVLLSVFGADPLGEARKMMVSIAETIVVVSETLVRGTYRGGPTKEWAEGISLAIGAFSPVYATLMDSNIMSIFGGNAMTGAEYTQVMRDVGQAIIGVADVFNEGGVSQWTGAPTKEWAEGAGLAIGAFAPVFDMMGGLSYMGLSTGTSPEDMAEAMILIAGALVGVGRIIGEKGPSNWGVMPDKEWGESFSLMVSTLGIAYEVIDDYDLDDSDDIAEYNKALLRMFIGVGRIVPLLSKMSQVKFGDGNTMGEISKAVDQWKDIMENLDELSDDDSILTMAIKNWKEALSELDDDLGDTDAVLKIAKNLFRLAAGFNKLSDSLTTLSTAIKGFNPEFISVLAEVSGVDVEIKEKTADDKDDGEEASWWNKILGNNEKKEEEKLPTVTTGGAKADEMSLSNVYDKLEELNQKLQVIASNSTNMSQYVNELRSGSNQGVDIGM